MAVRTYSQLIADIATYLTPPPKIRATQHRTLETNIVDTIYRYKCYVALLTQSGTNAPVPIELENGLGGSVVWSYSAVGQYIATGTGLFTVNKVATFIGSNATTTVVYQSENTSVNEITVTVFESNTVTPADDVLMNTAIEIRVYY